MIAEGIMDKTEEGGGGIYILRLTHIKNLTYDERVDLLVGLG